MHPERCLLWRVCGCVHCDAAGAIERELDRELRFHIDQEIENNIRLGMNPSIGRSAALRRLGRRRTDSGGMPRYASHRLHRKFYSRPMNALRDE